MQWVMRQQKAKKEIEGAENINHVHILGAMAIIITVICH